jgi:hypothetical protein
MPLSNKFTCYGLIVFGGTLFITATLGQWFGVGGYINFPPRTIDRTIERFDPELVKNTPSLDSLFQAAEARVPKPLNKLSPQKTMKILYETVSDRFTHGNKSDFSFFTNWILWGLGKLYHGFERIHDPDLLLRNGHSGLCSSISYVLMFMAQKAEIRVRHVGLYGHVVMEAWYDQSWHLYDPDLEVIPENEEGFVYSLDDLSKDADLTRQYYSKWQGHIYSKMKEIDYLDKIVLIITSREDNTFMSYPEGSWFVWKAQVLAEFEKFAQVLKFFVPVVLIMFGVIALKRKNS